MHASPGRLVAAVPAPGLFIASGLTQYAGAAVAIGLFSVIPAAGVAWLRLTAAAVVLILWRRPWRTPWTRQALVASALFGAALAAMNVTFYIAIDHLPLGTAVAIEFIGPVAVAALTGSGWRERAGIALAAAGVVLLAGVTLELRPEDARIGLAAILAAAACWAAYIVLGRRIAVAGDGVTRLGVAMAAGALLFAPVLAGAARPVLGSWGLVLAVVGVAVLSSVIPYALEQVVLRRVGTARFAVLLALLPATAAVVGAVALQQRPHLLDLVGLALVSGAIVLTSVGNRARARAPQAPAAQP